MTREEEAKLICKRCLNTGYRNDPKLGRFVRCECGCKVVKGDWQ